MTTAPALFALPHAFAVAGSRVICASQPLQSTPIAFGACPALNLFQTVHLIGTIAGAASSAFAARPRTGPRPAGVSRASQKINVYAVLQGRSPGIYAVRARVPVVLSVLLTLGARMPCHCCCGEV